MDLKDFFGQTFSPPPGISDYTAGSGEVNNLIFFLSNILRLVIYAAGLFALINLLVSGIQYLGSSGNPEMIKQASTRIWMSLLGLVIIAGSLILAAIIGLVFFNDASLIIKPIIPGP